MEEELAKLGIYTVDDLNEAIKKGETVRSVVDAWKTGYCSERRINDRAGSLSCSGAST